MLLREATGVDLVTSAVLSLVYGSHARSMSSIVLVTHISHNRLLYKSRCSHFDNANLLKHLAHYFSLYFGITRACFAFHDLGNDQIPVIFEGDFWAEEAVRLARAVDRKDDSGEESQAPLELCRCVCLSVSVFVSVSSPLSARLSACVSACLCFARVCACYLLLRPLGMACWVGRVLADEYFLGQMHVPS